MFDFFTRKRPQKKILSRIAPAAVKPSNSRQASIMQRDLIRVVLKDTLTLHGIPLGWLGCDAFNIVRSNGEDELHIQLIVLRWSEKLFRYGPALQQQLLLGLDRFDPSADYSRYVVSWRISATCGNPFIQMPDPKYWLQSVLPQVKKKPVPHSERRKTKRTMNTPLLEPSLFEAYERAPVFQATEIAPLR